MVLTRKVEVWIELKIPKHLEEQVLKYLNDFPDADIQQVRWMIDGKYSMPAQPDVFPINAPMYEDGALHTDDFEDILIHKAGYWHDAKKPY